MMIITDDRSALDLALQNMNCRILIFVGSNQQHLHDEVDSIVDLDPVDEYFLILDHSVLNDTEKKLWFGSSSNNPDGCYALVTPSINGRGDSLLLNVAGKPVNVDSIRDLFRGKIINGAGL